MKPDRINLRILTELQHHGRVTNQALAERVGLSPSACLDRVRRLQESGVVEGYGARIDLDRVCPSVTVIATVTLHDHRKTHTARFEEAVRSLDEVVECHQVSGIFDYLLRVVCRDMRHYQSVSDQLIEAGAGVIELSSHVVLDRTKTFTGYPLGALIGPGSSPHAK